MGTLVRQEHDCLYCGNMWDNNTEVEDYCPKCGTPDPVNRTFKPLSMGERNGHDWEECGPDVGVTDTYSWPLAAEAKNTLWNGDGW